MSLFNAFLQDNLPAETIAFVALTKWNRHRRRTRNSVLRRAVVNTNKTSNVGLQITKRFSQSGGMKSVQYKSQRGRPSQ
jgi:hypothetical protein